MNLGVFLSRLTPPKGRGIQFEPYAPEFNKPLKQIILERDSHKCQNPDCNIENPKQLHIHHIDYNKKNNDLSNLILLCNSCHTKTNGKNREYFVNYYQEIIMNRIREFFL